ncbi:MAG: formylmethanofuran dehydrogenase subunit E family protein [Polyangiaceae bacterium]|nr:formylmethanofuran dehydrogenase subunit E family protein [Polyangiaceae bacterium]
MRRLAAALCLLFALGCDRAPSPAAAPSPDDVALREVAAVHGGAGPWAVLGYRMGRYALGELGLSRHSFQLEVVHRSPRAVQFTCIADGASAATGASSGKLNLTLEPADEASVVTLYKNKQSGKELALRPAAAFVTRFKDVPRERLAEAGRQVLALPDAELFEAVPAR